MSDKLDAPVFWKEIGKEKHKGQRKQEQNKQSTASFDKTITTTDSPVIVAYYLGDYAALLKALAGGNRLNAKFSVTEEI